MMKTEASQNRRGRCRLTSLGILFCGLFAAMSTQAGHFRLVSTFWTDNDGRYPSKWEVAADRQQIFVGYNRRYKSDRCIGTYKNRFDFSVPIDRLEEGQRFEVITRKIAASTPCGHKWTKAAVKGSGNTLPPHGHNGVPASLETNGNIEVTGYDGDWHGTLRLYHQQHAMVTTHLLPQVKKSVRYTSISLESGDNVFYLIYEYVGNGGGGREPPPMAIQKSTFGNIHWDQGYYGNTTKTIVIDERAPGPNGQTIVRGRWGRTNSGDSGWFEFAYSDACTFTGTYWRAKGAKKSWKGWCG